MILLQVVNLFSIVYIQYPIFNILKLNIVFIKLDNIDFKMDSLENMSKCIKKRYTYCIFGDNCKNLISGKSCKFLHKTINDVNIEEPVTKKVYAYKGNRRVDFNIKDLCAEDDKCKFGLLCPYSHRTYIKPATMIKIIVYLNPSSQQYLKIDIPLSQIRCKSSNSRCKCSLLHQSICMYGVLCNVDNCAFLHTSYDKRYLKRCSLGKNCIDWRKCNDFH